MTKEENLQIAVADYLRLQYPKVLFCHIANERNTSPQRGGKLKRMGVRKGMPDILIFESTKLFNPGTQDCKISCCGLAIELKVAPNKPTEHQLEVLSRLTDEGWKATVCYSFDEARKLIDDYLG